MTNLSPIMNIKSIISLFFAGSFLLATSLPCLQAAEDELQPATSSQEKPTKQEMSKVAQAIKKLKTFNGKPNLKADYYIYLCSASWCGPCNKEMPSIVEAYKEMKKEGRVEILLIGYDQTDSDAKRYLKKYKAKFSGAMKGDKKIAQLPGYKPASGIPFCIFVTKDGKQVYAGHGSAIEDWKQYTIEGPEEKQATEE